MPRNYTRKTNKLNYTHEDLENAINAVRNDGKKKRDAARSFNVPESTLRRKLLEDTMNAPRLGRKSVFAKEVESELKDYILMLAKLFYGLTPRGLRQIAYRYAEHHNIPHTFNNENRLAGKDWLYGFLKRNPEIKLRQPEGTSLNRIASFNKEAVDLFYSNLKILLDKYKFQANRVFNMDETGITTVQNRCPKIYGPKGAKRIGAAISGERGRTITAVFCMSAAGNYIPAMLIYPRKRMPPTLQKNGPIGALYKCSKNGWINTDLFIDWLAHFERHVRPTPTDPVLLVLDNHSSHISIPAYTFCRQKNIHMVSLPPHTSHRLQPLDLTFFSPLKNALYREYNFYLSTTGHQKITEYEIAELLNKAFMKVATMEKAVSAFRTSGIFPLNSDRFSEEDYAPANEIREFVCERSPEPVTPTTSNSTQSQSPLDRNPGPSTSTAEPSTSKDGSFFAIAPIPKKKVTKDVKRQSRKKQQSEILTSTPIGEKLEVAEEKKRMREKNIKDKEEQNRTDKKGTVRKCFEEKPADKKKRIESDIKKRKGKKKIKKEPTPEPSDSSENDISDVCDDEQADVDSPPPPENFGNNEKCFICGEFGKDLELWYRCVSCSRWNHAECTGEPSPKNYICDYCSG